MSVFLFALVKRYNHNCSTVSEIWFTRENWIGYVICDAGIMLLWMISDWDHCAVFIMPALWLQEEKKKKTGTWIWTRKTKDRKRTGRTDKEWVG